MDVKMIGSGPALQLLMAHLVGHDCKQLLHNKVLHGITGGEHRVLRELRKGCLDQEWASSSMAVSGMKTLLSDQHVQQGMGMEEREVEHSEWLERMCIADNCRREFNTCHWEWAVLWRVNFSVGNRRPMEDYKTITWSV